MKFSDHERIADFVTTKLNLGQDVREALKKGSIAPDIETRSQYAHGRKGGAHHHSRERDIISHISSARESFCKQEIIESANNLGRAFHFIADSFITPMRDNEDMHDKEENTLSQLPLPKSYPPRLELSMKVVDFVEKNIGQKDIPIERKLEESCNICFVLADSVWRGCQQLTKTEKDLLLADLSKNLRREKENESLIEARTEKLKDIWASSIVLAIAIGVIVIAYFTSATNWLWFTGSAIILIVGIVYIRSTWFTALSQISHRLYEIDAEKKKYAWYWNHPLIAEEIKREFKRLEIEKLYHEQKRVLREELSRPEVRQPVKARQRLSVPSVTSLCIGCLWIIFPFLPQHISVYSTYEAAGIGALALGIIGLLRINKQPQTFKGKKESIAGIILGVTLMGINGYFIGLDIAHDRIPKGSATLKQTNHAKYYPLPSDKTETVVLSNYDIELENKKPIVIDETHKKDAKKTNISETVENRSPKPSSAFDPSKFYATKYSRSFHHAYCIQLDAQQELISFESIEEAVKSGGVPCNVCLQRHGEGRQ